MRKRILIVEDHDTFRETVRDYLKMQELGFEIFEASSGELAVVKALREKPDIVLMDIRLPGMTGIDAANRIKEYLPKCDIIFLTMFETDAFKKVFKSENAAAYIGKSELYERLIPTIQKIIKRSRNAQSS